MNALKSDAAGFLVGERIGDDEAAKMLLGIKGDTSRILAAIVKAGQMAAGERRRAASASARDRSAQNSAAAMLPRRMPTSGMDASARASLRARDALGRFVAGPSRPVATPVRHTPMPARAAAEPTSGPASPAKAAETATRVAGALQQMAGDQQKQRVATEAMARKRGADGRFGSGDKKAGEPGEGGRLRRMFSAVTASLRAGADGASEIDPALAAASEVKDLAARVKGVVAPLIPWRRRKSKDADGAAAANDGKSESGAQPKTQLGVMRRILAVLRQGGGAGGAAGGGLIGLAMRGLGAGIAALLPVVGAVTAAVGTAAGVFGALLKRLPFLGAAIELFNGWLEDDKIKIDPSLSPEQRTNARVANVAATGTRLGSMAAGAMAGAKLGALAGPVGATVGAVTGAGVGYMVGQPAAKYVQGAITSPAGQKITGDIGKRWESVKELIYGASQKSGANPETLAKIAHFESRFNSEARPVRRDGSRISSAHGLGQFLDDSWFDIVRRKGEKYGVAGAGRMSKPEIMRLRSDKALQAAMLGEFTAENEAIGAQLGGKDRDANVYALHNLGRGGGSRFLKAMQQNPGQPVSRVLGRSVVSGNPSLYGDGSITLEQAYANMGKAMSSGDRFALDLRATMGRAAMPKLPPMPAAPPVAMPKMPAAPDTVDKAAMADAARRPIPAAPASAPMVSIAQDVSDRAMAHILTGGIGGAANPF